MKEYTVHEEFVIEDLGIQDIYVYDIEVDEVHNFFANDILVHNSIYVDLDNVVQPLIKKNVLKDTQHLIDIIDKFCENNLQKAINDGFEELFNYMNNYENLMHMDREVISCPELGSEGLGGFWTGKKRYALNVYDSEGTRYAEPKIKILGLETQRSSTPSIIREVLKGDIKAILQKGESALHKRYKDFKESYENYHYTDIADVSSVNDIEKYSINGEPAPKTPSQVSGVLLYRKLVSQNNIKDALPINDGSKVMIMPLMEQNPWQAKWFSWLSGTEIPKDLEDLVLPYFNYNHQFKKSYDKPLIAICEACNITNEKIARLSDLFSF